MGDHAIRVAVHPRVAEGFHGAEMAMLTEVEERLGRQIIVESRTDFHLEHFELSAVDQYQKTVGRKFTPSDGLRDP